MDNRDPLQQLQIVVRCPIEHLRLARLRIYLDTNRVGFLFKGLASELKRSLHLHGFTKNSLLLLDFVYEFLHVYQGILSLKSFLEDLILQLVFLELQVSHFFQYHVDKEVLPFSIRHLRPRVSSLCHGPVVMLWLNRDPS